MADNLPINNDAATPVGTIATDEIGGVHYPRSKVGFGLDGSYADVSASDPLPVVAALPTGAATSAKQDTEIASLASIDTKTPALGQALAAASVPVVLTAAQLSTLTPTAGLTDAQLRATPVPVSGPLTDAEIRATALPVSAASLPLPTGAATSAKQDTLIGHVDGLEAGMTDAVTALQIMDDWDETNRAKVNPIVGVAGVSAGAGAVDTGTQRNTLASDDPAVTSLAVIDDWDESDRAKVNVIAGQAGITAGAGAVAANTPRVTHASDDPVTTSLQIMDDWDNAASDGASVTGDVAHDSADAGEPVKIGARASTSLAGRTMVADADRTDLVAGIDGAQIVRPHCNLEDVVSGQATDTTGNSTQCIAAQAAGVKTYLTTIILANSSSSNVTVDIKDGTTVKLTIPVPANGGAICNLPVPIGGTAATAWNFDASAAASTISCSMVGFKSKV